MTYITKLGAEYKKQRRQADDNDEQPELTASEDIMDYLAALADQKDNLTRAIGALTRKVSKTRLRMMPMRTELVQ